MSSKISLYKFPSLWNGCVAAFSPSQDQRRGGLTVYDQSGRQNHGTLSGMNSADWVTSENIRALDLDGTNDQITVPSPFSGIGFPTFSMSCWALLRSSARSGIMGNRSAGLLGYGISANRTTAGNITLVVGSAVVAEIAANIVLNRWTHFCTTITAAETGGSQLDYQVYVDGVRYIAARNSTNANTATLYYGTDSIAANYLNGQLDDMFVYNRALSASEVRLHAQRRGVSFETKINIGRYGAPASGGGGFKPYWALNDDVILGRLA